MGPTILVAHDFSPTADTALVWAGEIAVRLNGSLHLLHVIPLPSVAVAPETLVPISADANEVARAREALRSVANRHGLAATIDIVAGPHVGRAILAAAHETGADLVVMGTQGRGAVTRAVLGSVAEYVVRHADCPVVTLRRLPHR